MLLSYRAWYSLIVLKTPWILLVTRLVYSESAKSLIESCLSGATGMAADLVCATAVLPDGILVRTTSDKASD
jgi:hypothetical protein